MHEITILDKQHLPSCVNLCLLHPKNLPKGRHFIYLEGPFIAMFLPRSLMFGGFLWSIAEALQLSYFVDFMSFTLDDFFISIHAGKSNSFVFFEE